MNANTKLADVTLALAAARRIKQPRDRLRGPDAGRVPGGGEPRRGFAAWHARRRDHQQRHLSHPRVMARCVQLRLVMKTNRNTAARAAYVETLCRRAAAQLTRTRDAAREAHATAKARIATKR